MTDPLSPARLGELLEAYLAADYRWELDGRWHLLRIGRRAPEIDAAFPDAQRYALLTAWDPRSIARAQAGNRLADDALRALLDAARYRYRAAFSSAREHRWREPGWLVLDLPVEALDRLGRRFGQLGTLCWRRGAPVRLRMDAAAPMGAPRHGSVDWLK